MLRPSACVPQPIGWLFLVLLHSLSLASTASHSNVHDALQSKSHATEGASTCRDSPWPPDVGGDSVGNHRVCVHCPASEDSQATDAVYVRLDWRRLPQPNPSTTDCRVIARHTLNSSLWEEVTNRVVITGVDGPALDLGDVAFQPSQLASPALVIYELYCYPFHNSGARTGLDWEATYTPRFTGQDPDWLSRNSLSPDQIPNKHYQHTLSQCTISHNHNAASPSIFESRNQFHSFRVGEVPATTVEMAELFNQTTIRDVQGAASVYFFTLAPEPLGMLGGGRVPRAWIQNVSLPSQDYTFQNSDRGGDVVLTRPLEATAQRGGLGIWHLGLFPRNATYTLHGAAAAAFTPLELTSGRGPPDLFGECVHHIPADKLTVFNVEGNDWSGRGFEQTHRVEADSAGSVWIGVQVDADMCPGHYSGTLTLTGGLSHGDGKRDVGGSRTVAVVTISLTVSESTGEGDDIYSMHRLHWLNSDIGVGEVVTDGYAPIRVSTPDDPEFEFPHDVLDLIHGEGLPLVEDDLLFSASIAGRTVMIGKDGLPLSLQTEKLPFAQFGLSLGSDGGPTVPTCHSASILKHTNATVQWQSQCVAQTCTSCTPLSVTVDGELSFEGYLNYAVTLQRNSAVTGERNPAVKGEGAGVNGDCAIVTNVTLTGHVVDGASSLCMGMGRVGGYFLKGEVVEWAWAENVGNGSNMGWVGSVDAGVRVHLKGNGVGDAGGWESPLHVITADDIPTDSWAGSDTAGGMTAIRNPDGSSIIRAHSGSVSVSDDTQTVFRFDLLVTPVKEFDLNKHMKERYWQFGYNREWDGLFTSGANIVNLHQGQPQNPFINYPFHPDAVQPMTNFTEFVKKHGIEKVKIYYTTRELSNRAFEIPALYHLKDVSEIFLHGDGGGGSWLQEHLGSFYDKAWNTDLPSMNTMDLAIHNSGVSRWNNYYLRGLDWLLGSAHGPQIDGLYLDELAFARETMLRLRRTLEAAKPGSLIDLHSCNKFVCPTDSKNTVPATPSAALYLAHFPFIDHLWFGERFDYAHEKDDYWLVEVSGVPFGLGSEMLNAPSNMLWRGMLYSMWTRPDPEVWGVLDQLKTHVKGGEEPDMTRVGYWDTQRIHSLVALDCHVTSLTSSHSLNTCQSIHHTLYTLSPKSRDASPSAALLVVASWEPTPCTCEVKFNWDEMGLGYGASAANITSPPFPSRSVEFKQFDAAMPSLVVDVQPGKGQILTVTLASKHDQQNTVDAFASVGGWMAETSRSTNIVGNSHNGGDTPALPGDGIDFISYERRNPVLAFNRTDTTHYSVDGKIVRVPSDLHFDTIPGKYFPTSETYLFRSFSDFQNTLNKWRGKGDARGGVFASAKGLTQLYRKAFSSGRVVGVIQQVHDLYQADVPETMEHRLAKHCDAAVQSLPEEYGDGASYRLFIDQWGSHYISGAHFGGIVELHVTLDAAVLALPEQRIIAEIALDLDRHLGTSKQDLLPEYAASKTGEDLKKYGGVPDMSDDWEKWLDSVVDAPVMTSFTLSKTSTLVRDSHKESNLDRASNEVFARWAKCSRTLCFDHGMCQTTGSVDCKCDDGWFGGDCSHMMCETRDTLVDSPLSAVTMCPPDTVVVGIAGGYGHSATHNTPHRLKCCHMGHSVNSDDCTDIDTLVDHPVTDFTVCPSNTVVVGISGGQGHSMTYNTPHRLRCCPFQGFPTISFDSDNHRTEVDKPLNLITMCPPNTALTGMSGHNGHSGTYNEPHGLQCSSIDH